ncbi:MAG: DUF5305 family protein [Halobacteriales archaeon]|nr:DUF5305 family protein [Halobacteriales archaeon]
MKEANKEIDSPSEWKVRIRSGLDSWAPAVAVLLVVVALIGGWMTYTAYAVEEEPEVEEVVTAEWSTNPGFRHSATVERSNPLYEVGEEVRNKPAYYTSVTPSLDGTHSFEYTATEDGSLDVVTEVSMMLRETDGNNVVYWSQTENLVRKETTDVKPQQTVRTGFTVNVPEVEQRIESVRTGLGANIGDEEVVLVLVTSVSGEVNGEEVNYRERDRVQVEINSDTYTVNTGEGGVQGSSFETTEMVEVESEPDTTRMVVSPLFVLVSLGLLAGLIAAKRRDAIMPTERQLLAMERREFDEWISTGELSEDVLHDGRRSLVRVDSIEGIVDVAIDCGRRVIEDREEAYLSVMNKDVVYVYEYEVDIWKPTEEGIGEDGKTDEEPITVMEGETTEAEKEDGENGETEDADKQDDGIDIFERLKRSDD